MSLINSEQLSYPLNGSFSGSLEADSFTMNGVPQFNWGSLNSINSQYILIRDTPQEITYDNVDINSRGIYLENNSQIHVSCSGVYNIQFSAQIYHEGDSTEDVYIWFRQNGSDIPNSNTKLTLIKKEYHEASWNFFITCSNNDYIQLLMSATHESLSLTSLEGLENMPDIPSIITTINQVAPYN